MFTRMGKTNGQENTDECSLQPQLSPAQGHKNTDYCCCKILDTLAEWQMTSEKCSVKKKKTKMKNMVLLVTN